MTQEIIYTGGKPRIELSEAFAQTMEELIAQDKRVVYVDADLMGSMKTKRLWKQYPQNVMNTGIQEANLVGVAAGLYLSGMKPYIHSFAPFVTRRVFDQLFISVAYAGKSVRVIGSDAGIMATDNGGTHMCFEDMAMMRAVPSACVVDVSDAQMFQCLLRETKERPGVTYFRTARRNVPDLYPAGTPFRVGEGKLLREGGDVTLLACGVMVSTALEAARLLERKGISARVIDAVTVKPLDERLLRESVEKTGAVVTAENHNVMGGLGSAAAEFLCENHPAPLVRIGVRDRFGQVGTEEFLRRAYGLTPSDLAEAARRAIGMKLGRMEKTMGKTNLLNCLGGAYPPPPPRGDSKHPAGLYVAVYLGCVAAPMRRAQ